jgi:hypothetical protein
MVVSFLPVGDRPNRQLRSDHLHSLKMDHLWKVATNARHLQPLRHRHHLLRLVGLLLGRDLRGLRLQPQHRPLRSRLLPLSRRLHQFRALPAVHGSFQVFFIFAFSNFLTPITPLKKFLDFSKNLNLTFPLEKDRKRFFLLFHCDGLCTKYIPYTLNYEI